DLMLGMYCPRSGSIKLHVSAPRLQRFTRLANFLKGECQVVVSVGVGLSQLNCSLVSCDGLLHTPNLVEYIAKIEISQRIAWVDLDRRAIVFLGVSIFLPVVVKSPEIDVSSGVIRIHIENLQIDGNGLVLRARLLFESDSTGKQLSNV